MNRTIRVLSIVPSILIILVLLVSPALAAGNPPSYYWHAFLGSIELDQANAMAVDGGGNIIIAGTSTDAWNGPAGQSPKNPFFSDQEITVAKFARTGGYSWHTFYGTGNKDEAYAMAVNPDGRILVVGSSQFEWKGPGNIDPKHPHSGVYDLFVLCLAADGTYLWHTFYGTNSSTNEVGLAVTWDTNGDVVVAGVTDNEWKGPGTPGTDPLHSYTGGDDLFILKLGSDGAYQWHTFFGSTDSDRAWGVTTDPNNNIYLTGESRSSWNGPLAQSPLNIHGSSGTNEDILVMRLEPAGAYAWHAFYGSTEIERGRDILMDGTGNLYITGESYSGWDYPSGPTPPLHEYSGALDIIVLKLVPAPTSVSYAWHTYYGSTDNDFADDLTIGPAGLVVGGTSFSTWNGFGGAAPLNAHAGGQDIMGLGLSTDGAYQWHTFHGSSSDDSGLGAGMDVNNNVTLAGWSAASWNGPGGVAPKTAHVGNRDIAIVKLASRYTKIITSTGAQDGWILESGEITNTGGTMNTIATTLRLGDDAAKKQYRSILSFATGAGLPDNAVITKVTLKVRKQGILGGGDPVNTFKGFMVDIKKGFFGTTALQITDFQAAAHKTYGPFVTALSGGWYSIDLTPGKGYINKMSTLSGLTQIRLRFKLDDNNNTVANYLSLYSGNAGAASRPQLIVEYYVP